MKKNNRNNNSYNNNNKVSISLVYDLTYDRKYEELIKYLEDKRRKTGLDRLGNITLRLAQNVLSDSIKMGKVGTTSFEAHDNYRKFFEALRLNDYYEAYNQVVTLLKFKNDQEMQIFKLILEDIISRLDNNDYVKDISKEVNEINKEAYEIIKFKEELTNEEVDQLIEIFEREIDYVVDSGCDPMYQYIFLQIVEMIKLTNNHAMDKKYFKTLDYTDLTVEERLKESLIYGDYVTAFSTIMGNAFKLDFKGIDYNYLVLIKRLLFVVNTNLNKKVKSDYKLKDNYIEGNKFYELLKEEKYVEAYNYCINNNIKVDEEILANLILLISYPEEDYSRKLN